jgi:PKD repeat protein
MKVTLMKVLQVNYTAIFNAEDENGNTATQNLTVRVGKEPVAEFTYFTTTNGLILTNTSTDNPTSYLWTFGNGQTSTAANSSAGIPLYTSNDATYPTYEVCLTSKNRFNDAPFSKTVSTTCKSITLTVGIADRYNLDAAVEIYPNPSNGLINVEISETGATELTVEVTNVLGAVVASKNITKVNSKESVSFNLEGSAAGIYFVNVSSNNATISKRVIIK